MIKDQKVAERIRRTLSPAWRNQSGSALVDSMVGAFVGLLLITAVVASMTGLLTNQRVVQQVSAKATDLVTMEAAFRQDVTWAANIPSEPASATGFTAVVPGTGVDGACRVSTWTSAPDKVTNLSRTYERATTNPGSYSPGSESGSTGCTGEMVAEDERSWDLAGDEVQFAYRDIDDAVLFKTSGTRFSKSATSTEPVRIGGVEYDAGSGGHAYQTALNLDQPEDPAASSTDTGMALTPQEHQDDPGLMVSTWNPSLQRDIHGGTHACQPDEYPLVLPLTGDIDVKVNWGDGSERQWVLAPYPFHCYSNGDQRTVEVFGKFGGWGEKDQPQYGLSATDETRDSVWKLRSDRTVDDLLRQRTTWSSEALLSVDEWWDETGTTDLSEAFYGAESLTKVARIPNTTTTLDGALAFTTKNITGVSSWDTARVTSMKGTFQGATGLNPDLSSWNTSLVITMADMFNGAAAYNRPIPTTASWNTSKVKDMSGMFSGATMFNGSIAGLETAAVTDFSEMFRDAKAFNQPVATLVTTNATDLTGMFHGAAMFNRPTTGWNTAQAVSTAHMFEHAKAFNSSVADLDTALVTNMNDMFRYATAFNHTSASGLDTSKVQSFARMFMEAVAFNQAVEFWATGAATDMSGMFSGATVFNQKVSNWNTGNVVTMSGMFHDADAFNELVDTWDVRKVKDMSGMFSMTEVFHRGLMSWEPISLENAGFMFNGAQAYNHPINSWGEHASNLNNTEWMFANAPRYNQPLDQWNTSKVTKMGNMFLNSATFNQDISDWDVSKVNDFWGMFNYATKFNQDISQWNVSAAKSASNMIAGASSFDQDLSSWDLSGTTGQNSGFAWDSPLRSQASKLPAAVRSQAS